MGYRIKKNWKRIMEITRVYGIDEARYQAAGHHRILLETIQYTVGSDILTSRSSIQG